jgi:hypothetical protein
VKTSALITFGFLCCLVGSLLAHADTTSQDVSSDNGAIHKENNVISKDQSDVASNLAAKGPAKANDDSASQALDSVKIAASKTTLTEKQT